MCSLIRRTILEGALKHDLPAKTRAQRARQHSFLCCQIGSSGATYLADSDQAGSSRHRRLSSY
jgi:hypothetical protein